MVESVGRLPDAADIDSALRVHTVLSEVAVSARFSRYRHELDLPAELSLHAAALYVTHMIEAGSIRLPRIGAVTRAIERTNCIG